MGEAEKPIEKLQLIITLENNGQVNVTGPITNKMLCYGLLEIAKDLVKDYKPIIEQPKGGIMNFIRGKN